MNVTASAGIAPAWTATRPTPATAAPAPEAETADQPVEETTKPQEVAEKSAEPRRAPEGQGTRIDIRV
jgi:hypothetical protein